MNKQKQNKQQGFALLTVLLIVSLITIIASQMLYQQALDIQRSENRLHQAQSNAVIMGLATWIKKGLKLDAELNKIDHLQEEWAKPMPPIPFAGGEVAGQLFDWQGLLNVNNLQNPEQAEREFWQDVFQRFFEKQQQSQDPNKPAAVPQLTVNMTAVLMDWVDADNETLEEGAESDVYQLKRPPYRAANAKLVLQQEMLLLEGMNAQLLKQWQGLLSTLPESNTKLNINTMPQAVLVALADWMTDEIASAWVERRKTAAASELKEFEDFLVQQTGLELEEIKDVIVDKYFDVKSHYFYLVGQVSFGESQQGVKALFYRQDKQQVNLIQRWFSAIEAVQAAPESEETSTEDTMI